MFENIKENKIIKFIEKHSLEFEKTDTIRLKKKLLEANDFTKMISKIEKLDETKQKYILETIKDYDKYKLNSNQLLLIVSHKLDIIKIKNIKEYPQLDKIYYALKPNENLYKNLVIEYIDSKKKYMNSEIQEYLQVIEKCYLELHNFLDNKMSTLTLKKQLLFLKPKKLEQLLKYDLIKNLTIERKKQVFNSIVNSGIFLKINLENLNQEDFNRLLKFIFFDNKNKIEENDSIEIRLKLLNGIMMHNKEIEEINYVRLNHDFIRFLESIPNELLEKMVRTKEIDKSYEFIKSLESFDCEITYKIINKIKTIQTPKSNDMFVKFIKDDFFINSNKERQLLLLGLFPNDIEKTSIDQNIELVIPDSEALKEQVNANETMEFINPTTKAKIYLKNKNSQKN